MAQLVSQIVALLKKNPVGLDISDRTIEIVELSQEGKEVKMVSMSRVFLPKGVVEKGRIRDTRKLAVALDQVMKNARPEAITPKKIIFAIPEGQVYTHVFELGPHKQEDRDRIVQEEMAASIPLQKDEVLSSYTTMYESSRLTGIALIAVRREVFDEWQNFFKTIGFEVDMYESETFATARGLFNAPLQSPICIVDIGAATTTISIFSKQGLRYLQSFPYAGDAITLSLGKELNIPLRDAERMKIKIGLSDQKDKSFFVIIKTLQAITQKVKVSIDYFQDKTGERVERAVLVGGSAKLKGIKEYFEENLGTSVWLGESIFLRSQAFLEYIEASGLAFRGLYPKKFTNDPSFLGYDTGKHIVEQGDLVQGMTDQEQNQGPVIISSVEFVRTPASRGQQIVLLAILIMGIVGIFGAVWFRDRWDTRSNAQTPPVAALRESGIQIFNEDIQIIVLPEEDIPGGAHGEIFEDEVPSATSYANAVADARANAVKIAAEKSQQLWQEPINRPADEQNITFPLRVQWLLYPMGEVTDLLLEKVRQKTNIDVSALSPYVSVLNIMATANPNIFTLYGRVRVKTSEFITVKNIIEPTIVEKPTPRIIILDTTTGWLNARKGPGTTYAIVTRVYAGGKYILLEEKGKWYKIQLSWEGEQTAWVSSQYAQKE